MSWKHKDLRPSAASLDGFHEEWNAFEFLPLMCHFKMS